MGMTEEEWETFCTKKDGIEIREGSEGCLDAELLVDDSVVWKDGTTEPEDVLLCRDLQAFVHVIKHLAAQRTALRLEVEEQNIARTEAEEVAADLKQKLTCCRHCGDFITPGTMNSYNVLHTADGVVCGNCI